MAIVDRSGFFLSIFGRAEGIVCIATKSVQGKFSEKFFSYPNELNSLLDYVDAIANTQDVWLCPNILSAKKRDKTHVKYATCVWADLDECKPEKLLVEPTIVIETSPARWQAYWIFEQALDPQDAQEVSRRVAYYHANDGCDKGCWDMTRLLRIPKTRNNKYNHTLITTEVRTFNRSRFRLDDFKEYPTTTEYDYLEIPFPNAGEINSVGTGEEVLAAKRYKIPPMVWSLFYQKPESDWSKSLWQLESQLVESGLGPIEIYVIARDSACNKYERDGRSHVDLWREVTRAYSRRDDTEEIDTEVNNVRVLPGTTQFVYAKERETVPIHETFVHRYIQWATERSDASPTYHEAAGFVLLSAVLCGRVVLPTSFGRLYPNLWFMVVGDTTLTRKSTSMDMAMDLLAEVDENAILATDGTIEGLLGTLAQRPGHPSIFLRDEFSGLLESMVKKDYYAGMAEFLTKLYDGRMQKRVLRREVIEVRDPRLIMYVGGIKEKIAGLLTDEHVTSGFLPRFLFAVGTTDLTRMRPVGPPTELSTAERDKLISEIQQMSDFYNTTNTLTINGNTIQTPKIWDAELTPEAWERYNQLEADLLRIGTEDEKPELMTPVCDRMAKSALKVAVLIRAADFALEGNADAQLVVNYEDIVRAAYYAEKWFVATREIMGHVGITADERFLDTILRAVQRQPTGVPRSQLMRNYKISAKYADVIAQTLEQRGQIKRHKSSKSNEIWEATSEGGRGKGRRITIR